MVFDDRILREYRAVFGRSKFGFDATDIARNLEMIEGDGIGIAAPPLSILLPDPTDRPFLEVAVACRADALVTGNLRHFSAAARRLGVTVVSPTDFLGLWRARSRR